MAIGPAATLVLAAAVAAAAFGSRPRRKKFLSPPQFDVLGTHQNVVVAHNAAAVHAFNENPAFYPMLVANQQGGGTDTDWETMTEWFAAVAEARPDVTFGIVPVEVIQEMRGLDPDPSLAVALAYAPSRYEVTTMGIVTGLDDFVAEQAINQMLPGA